MRYDDYKDKDYIDENCEEYMDEGMGQCEGTEPTGQKRRMIEVEEVLGTGSAETTVEVCIPLNPPAFEVMEELVTRKLEFDALVATKGKVFINARLIKDIPYKTRVRKCVPGCPKIESITYGNIRHATVEIPVALCIDIPEACKGHKVVVLDYEINSVDIPFNTNCIPGKCISACENPVKRMDPCMRRLFCSITEKDCISVTVKVVKDVIIEVPSMGSNFQQ
jgi:hypothetical protein